MVWCAVRDDNGGIVFYCISCLLGWAFLGVIGLCSFCMIMDVVLENIG